MDNCSCDVVSLQDLCLLTVANYLYPSNVWSIYKFVPDVHCKRIEHIVYSFICDNFMNISHTEEFLALDEKEMQWLVDNDEIRASEAAMLAGLTRWYKHSEHLRENAFKRLFDRLNVNVIERDVLWQIIKKYQLCKVIPDLRKYKVFRFLPRRVPDLDKLIHDENIFKIIVIEQKPDVISDPGSRCEMASFWVPFACYPVEQDHPGYHKYVISNQQGNTYKLTYIVPFRESFFAFGMLKRNVKNDFIPVTVRLDFHLQTFTHCKAPVTRVLNVRRPLIVTCGIYIYLLGGCDDVELNEYLSLRQRNNVYRYDTVKDDWKEMSPMIHCHDRSSHTYLGDSTIVTYKNRSLYVFGMQYNEKYDLCTNTWSEVPPPPYTWIPAEHRRVILNVCRISAYVMNDKIYVLDSFFCEVLVFDPLNETWQRVPELSQCNEPCNFFKCFPQECLGEYFSTFDDKTDGSWVWHVSAVDEHLREIPKKKLYSAKARNSIGCYKPSIRVLSRRARLRLAEHSPATAQTEDIVLVL